MKTTGKIKYGDRILARVMINGQSVVEFMVECVSNMSELLAELRYHARKYRGLVRLYVRNFSQGWSIERPLMLYVPNNEAAAATFNQPAQPQRKMLFPWETH